MSKRSNCFAGAALVLTFTILAALASTSGPDQTSLLTIQGVVYDTYRKTKRTRYSSTKYRVAEIKAGSKPYVVYIEIFTKFKKIEIGDAISVNAVLTPGYPNIYHAWQLTINDNSAITYEEFIRHHRKMGRDNIRFGILFSIALIVAGMFSSTKRSV